MSKPSATTLFRQAKEAKTKKARDALRKEGNLLRRAERNRKKTGKMDKEVAFLVKHAAEQAAAGGTGGWKALTVDERIKMANDDGAEARIRQQSETHSMNVVCAFIAEMNGIAALNRGPLPRALMVSGYTLARVCDALRQAGYTEDGKGGMRHA